MNRLLKEASFYTSKEVAKRFELEGVVSLVALYALLIAAMLGRVPSYLLLVVPVFYARYLLGGHEILHSPWGMQINPLTRLMPFCQSLLTLGYEQYRDIHLRHHRYFGTKADPEDYLVSASHGRALALALIAPERAYVRWVQQKGMSKRLAVETLIRATLFVGFLVANPKVFLVYFAVIRVAIWGSEVFFHNILHMDDLAGRQHLVHELAPGFWWPTLRVVLGSAKVDILLEHDVHHTNQLVAAYKLAEAREFMAARGQQVQHRPSQPRAA